MVRACSMGKRLGHRHETKRRARATGPAVRFGRTNGSVDVFRIVSGKALVRLVRDQRAQLLAGLEHRHRPRGHLDRLSGARVPGHPGLAAPDLEGAEPADLYVVLLLEGVLDGIEKRVHHPRTSMLCCSLR